MRNSIFYITNINEWVVDIIIKTLLNKLNDRKMEIVDRGLNPSEFILTESFEILKKYIKIFSKIESSRKSKAIEVLNKTIFKYFFLSLCSELTEFFILYVEIKNFQKFSQSLM